jgi:hypothetical protein
LSNGAPITGYRLYFAEEGQEYQLIYDGTGRSDVLTFTITQGVLKSHTYKTKVSALNAIGESQRSSKLQSFIAIVPSIPPSLDMVVSGEGTV